MTDSNTKSYLYLQVYPSKNALERRKRRKFNRSNKRRYHIQKWSYRAPDAYEYRDIVWCSPMSIKWLAVVFAWTYEVVFRDDVRVIDTLGLSPSEGS